MNLVGLDHLSKMMFLSRERGGRENLLGSGLRSVLCHTKAGISIPWLVITDQSQAGRADDNEKSMTTQLIEH